MRLPVRGGAVGVKVVGGPVVVGAGGRGAVGTMIDALPE